MGVNGISPLRVPLITAGSVGANPGGTSQWVGVSAYSNLTFYLKTNGSPGAGTLVIEEMDCDPKSGQPDTSLTGSTIDTVTITSGVGNSAQTAKHYVGSFSYVRARIGTTVTTATLDVVLVAN